MHDADLRRFEQRTIPAVLRSQADAVGDETWLMFGDRHYTFAEVDRLSDGYARGLAERGIGAGDVVAVFMGNCPEFVLGCLALAKLGAVHLPVNTAYKGAYLEHVLGHSGACAVLVDDDLLPRVEDVLDAAPGLGMTFVRGDATSERLRSEPVSALLDVDGRPPSVDVDPRQPLSVLYTSGTTGRAKGAVMSHHYWCSAVRAICDARDVRPGDTFFSPTPLFHAGVWLYNVYCALLTGLRVGIDERYTASGFWDRVRHYGATQLQSTGAMHMFVWNQPERPDDADNPARVWVPVPLPPELCEPFKARFGIEHLVFQYGQTEVVPVSVGAAGTTTKAGSAGTVLPHFEVQIQDDLGRPVDAGTVGEICVRPREPHVMFDGYHRDPEATARTWRGLWHHTGDLGRIDEDGELFYVDRKDDYLRIKGENISSFEVEAVVAGHPAVDLVAAHAVPSEVTEDELKICVVTKPGCSVTNEELFRYCDDHLPYFAVPRYFEVVESLPMTPTGRTQKHLLRQAGVTGATWDRVAAGVEVTR